MALPHKLFWWHGYFKTDTWNAHLDYVFQIKNLFKLNELKYIYIYIKIKKRLNKELKRDGPLALFCTKKKVKKRNHKFPELGFWTTTWKLKPKTHRWSNTKAHYCKTRNRTSFMKLDGLKSKSTELPEIKTGPVSFQNRCEAIPLDKIW